MDNIDKRGFSIDFLEQNGFFNIENIDYLESNIFNDLKTKLGENDFYTENIFFNGNENIILIGNGVYPYGALLTDMQKELLSLPKGYNIILISKTGYRTNKNNQRTRYLISDEQENSMIQHELIELKYWSKMKDRLPFIPSPEAIDYYDRENINIKNILNEDPRNLTREFLRGELIHLKANGSGYKDMNNNKSLTIQRFDALSLDQESTTKIKNAYIEAQKILKIISLLSTKRTIASDMNEEDFLNILDNPVFEVEKILQTRHTNHKIEKVLSFMQVCNSSIKNFSNPTLAIDGYYSYPITVKTTIKVTAKLDELDGLIEKYVKNIIENYKLLLSREVIQLCSSYAVEDNSELLDIAINDFNDKVKDISVNITESYQGTIDSDFGRPSDIIKDIYLKNKEIDSKLSINSQCKKITDESYNLILNELRKREEQSQERLEKHKGIESSIFAQSDFSDFLEEIEEQEINFDYIPVESFSLFTTGKELMKAFEEEYEYKGGNIEDLSYEEEIIDAHNKRIIVKESGSIIFDLTIGNSQEENDFIFHYHDFCSGSEEYTTKMIIDRVNSAGIINIDVPQVEYDENIKERQKNTY